MNEHASSVDDQEIRQRVDEILAESRAMQREQKKRMLAHQHAHWRRRTTEQWRWEGRWARYWIRFTLRRWRHPVESRVPDWRAQEIEEYGIALMNEHYARQALYGDGAWPAVDTRTSAPVRWLQRLARPQPMTEQEIRRTTFDRSMREFLRTLDDMHAGLEKLLRDIEEHPETA